MAVHTHRIASTVSRIVGTHPLRLPGDRKAEIAVANPKTTETRLIA